VCVDRADYARRLVTDHQQRFGSFTPAHVVEELRAALRVLLAGLRRCGAECGKVRRGTVDRGLWGRGVGLAGLMAARIVGCDPIMAFDPLPSRLVLARELGATREDSRRDLRQIVMDEV
jgi:threonine dehydrogenase-like Zn-dependent dehydrogenase